MGVGEVLGLAFGLAGSGRLIYEHMNTISLIRGRIVGVVGALMSGPEFGGRSLAIVLPYVYLTNARRAPVHVLDVGMEVFTNGEWRALTRLHGDAGFKPFSFQDPLGNTITVQDVGKHLLPMHDTPVEYGKPIHGWVPFVTSPRVHSQKASSVRLTFIDAYKGKHMIEVKSEEIVDYALLINLAGLGYKMNPGSLPPSVL